MRPYLTGLVGPYIGASTSVSPGSVSDKVLAVPGVYLGGGVDFRIGGHFMLGVGLGGDLMPDFSEPLAGRKDYRSFQMSLNFGWAWGKGHTASN